MPSSSLRHWTPHWPSLLIAIVVATGLWFTVTRMERIEAAVEVGLDYFGTPPNLVVTDGLVGKVAVRLRGASTMIRSVLQQRQTLAVPLDPIQRGSTTIPLEDIVRRGMSFKHFEVVEIQPPKIQVQADILSERTVPLRAKFVSSEPDAVVTENTVIDPPEVIVRGPEREVSRISFLTLNIPVDMTTVGTVRLTKVAPTLPNFVTTNPSTVRVQFTVTSPRTQVRRRCKVNLQVEDRRGYTIEPAEIDVEVEVPSALARKESYLSRIQVRVTPPFMTSGSAIEVPLSLLLPEGMVEVGKTAERVLVTKRDVVRKSQDR